MSLKINIGGKERGIKFTMLSLEKFEEKSPLTKVPETARMIYATFWAGLVGYSVAKEEEEDYTYEDVQEWVDKLYLETGGEEIIKQVCDEWAAADMFKNRIKQVEDWANKIRSLSEEETPAPKKKVKSISNGSQSISSPLAT